jgi:hypothetical protein
MQLSFYGNVYLSVFDFIEDNLISDGFIVSGQNGGLTLMDAYPDDDQLKKVVYSNDFTDSGKEIPLPVLTIELSSPITGEALELGTNHENMTFPFMLTLFAETDIQRAQVLGSIDTMRRKSIDYKDFDVDFSNPPVSGTLLVDEYRVFPTDFVDSPNKAIKIGADILFNVSFAI